METIKKECQICGSKKVQVKTGTEIFEYKGKKIPIENYAVTYCDNCKESVADPECRQRSIPILRDAQRSIDGFLTSHEIKAIRKSLKLTQDDCGELLGGGEKAFARYETGKVLQSRPMDNLLRILQASPEVLEVLKQNAGHQSKTMPLNAKLTHKKISPLKIKLKQYF